MNISVRNLRDPYFAFLWLQQVALNLLIKAIKAVSELDEGPRELSVTSQKVNEVHGEAGKEVTEGNALMPWSGASAAGLVGTRPPKNSSMCGYAAMGRDAPSVLRSRTRK